MTNRRTCWLACAGIIALVSGCVERRFTVQSEPAGAKVYVNNKPVGFTPIDVPFTYYGKYLITLEYPGYQTKHVEERIKAPLYAYPPSDFVVECIYPGTVTDIRQLEYTLDPMPRPNLDELLIQADMIRARGKDLPEPTIPTQQRQRQPVAPSPDNPRNRVLPPPQSVPPKMDPVP
jgi:hypothetical protein